MTTGGRTFAASILAVTLLLASCRSDDADTPSAATDAIESSTTAGAATDTGPAPTGSTSEPGTTVAGSIAPPGTEPISTEPISTEPISTEPITTEPITTEPITTQPPPPAVAATVPPDADELALSDSFSDESPTWAESTWEVDVPGEATAAVIDDVGVMATDARGTHEWVRAVAPGSTHDDVTLSARITPVASSEGTVFVGLHGDGEWQDRTPYLPLSGVAVEYAYSPIFEGEIVLIVFDGSDEQRIGPVLGPVLDDGESADIRFEVVDGVARVKIWRSDDDEPAAWGVEANVLSTDGVVQISYRDGVDQSVAWDELTLQLWP